MFGGCLVCVIFDSSSYIPSYSNLTCYGCPHIEHVCALILCTYINIFGIVELRHYYLLIAYIVYLCVICSSNRFHSLIFILCIMIGNTLKMCTGDAGPEQSLVLFSNVKVQ